MWCVYNRSLTECKPFAHEETLPAPVLEAIKRVYRQLSQAELLEKCLHGEPRTQTSRSTMLFGNARRKMSLLGFKLKIATADAVLSFNDGSTAQANILKSFGLNSGRNTVSWLKEVDDKQRYFVDRAARQLTKEARQDR